MLIADDRRSWGRLLMRGLATEINGFWAQCQRVEGGPVPGGTLEIDDLDDLVIELNHALVSIRSLDNKIFDSSAKLHGRTAEYTSIRDGDPCGRTVRALTGPRNNAVHHPEVVDPDVARVVGPVGGFDGPFIVFPRWRSSSNMPASMFEHKGKPQASLVAAYDDYASGRLIMETLLDAFAFFEAAADGGLARRAPDGQLVGFPLAPLAVPGYLRLSPDWPNKTQVDADLRARLTAEKPSGLSREVLFMIQTEQGPVLCGYTELEHSRQAFTDTVGQIVRDIEAGYNYTHRGLPLGVAQGNLLAEGQDLVTTGALAAPDASDTRPWTGWWQLCVDDAEYYSARRRQ